jgi:hypothetical protein
MCFGADLKKSYRGTPGSGILSAPTGDAALFKAELLYLVNENADIFE